jgi:hypothetical protein
MRLTAVLFSSACALAFAGCASVPFLGQRGGETAPAPSAEGGAQSAAPADATGAGGSAAGGTAGETEAQAQRRRAARPDGSPDQLDPNAAPPPAEQGQGFLRNLARRLGADSNVPNVGPCPPVRVLYDASRFVQLTGAERFENIGYTGEMNGTDANCRYVGPDPIDVELTVNMAFGKGPRATAATTEVSWWVAVTQVVRTTDPASGQVVTNDIGPLATQRFTQTVTFPAGADRVTLRSPVTRVSIPRANERISGSNFEVLVGFDLTPEQLQFNRDGKRFRVDAGAPR